MLSEKEAKTLTASKYLSDFFEKGVELSHNPKAVCNWLTSDIARILNEKEMEPDEIPFTAEDLTELIGLIDKGTISSKIAKDVLEKMFEEKEKPSVIIEKNGWVQISDEGAIKEVVKKILDANPQ